MPTSLEAGAPFALRSADDRDRLERATADLDPPFALVDLDAFDANAADMARRAAGKPIRLATKSVRCRTLQERTLARDGFRGMLAFTLPEALWLAEHGFDDLLVAYPTADRARAARARRRAGRARAIAVMVDSTRAPRPGRPGGRRGRPPVRVCLDLDAGSWPLGGRLQVGAKRSPVHTPEQAAALAARDRGAAGVRARRR